MSTTIKLGDILFKKNLTEPSYVVSNIDDKNYTLKVLDKWRIMILVEKEVGGIKAIEPHYIKFPQTMTISKKYFERPEILDKYHVIDNRLDFIRVRKKNQFANPKLQVEVFRKAAKLVADSNRQSL